MYKDDTSVSCGHTLADLCQLWHYSSHLIGELKPCKLNRDLCMCRLRAVIEDAAGSPAGNSELTLTVSGELQNAALVLAFSEGETEDASNETLHYPMTLSTTTATLDPSQTLKVTTHHTPNGCTRVTAFLCQSLYTVCELQSACNRYTDEYSRLGGVHYVMLMSGLLQPHSPAWAQPNLHTLEAAQCHSHRNPAEV